MFRLAVRLFIAMVLCLTALSPTIGVLTSEGESCEGCSCDQNQNTTPEQPDKKHLPCPPLCGACFCSVLSIAIPHHTKLLASLPTYTERKAFFELESPLPGEPPSPPYQPPKI